MDQTEQFLKALTEAHGIKPLKILDQDLRRFLGLTWLKARSLSPAARALREFMMARN